jgi:WD40 repeat protein/serine/threonine protein kinase
MTGLTGATALRIPDYELLRLVGRGAYGEVWMARNALGSLRAVKAVWRRNFEEERPYEREFHGIRKFEPVSRKHEGLVDVYHVGSNNESGYFYYVMELADDATSLLAAGGDGEYRPLTLREEMRVRGRMPVGRVLEIGAKLASALDHLHHAGLVHRDVKPSNIIFVGGSPKLADIGLVAGISDARSYVGTEGFVPPEGPGTPAADIYSLGKVLYEMSTGLDRNEFPKLPPVGGVSGIDAREFSEFNEILLRACEPSEKLRYRTAAELFGDLAFLQGGKSLRRMRALERRTAFLSKLGIVAAILAVLASAGYYRSVKKIERARQTQRELVARNELLEMQKAEDLFQRDDSGGALAHLAQILRANPANRVATERLLAALTWRNFPLPIAEPITPSEPIKTASFRPDGREIVGGAASGALFAWDAATGQTNWSYRLGESERTDETAGADELIACEWSPDTKSFRLAAATRQLAVLFDPVTHEADALDTERESEMASVQFVQEGRLVLGAKRNGNAQLWQISPRRWAGPPISHPGGLKSVAIRRDGRLMATTGLSDGAARLWDTRTGQPIQEILRHGKQIQKICFSPDGRFLATIADDSSALLWSATGKLVGQLSLHRGTITDVAFSPEGGRLATASEDGTAILWDLHHSTTFSPIGNPMQHRAWVRQVEFSPDGLKLLTVADDNTTRIWDATRAVPLSEPMRHLHPVVSAKFAPRGDRMLSVASSAGESSLWLWKTTSRSAKKQIITGDGSKRTARFVARSGLLVTAADQHLRSWSLTNAERPDSSIDVGVPVNFFNVGEAGDRAVVVSGSQAWIWDLSTKQSINGPLNHPGALLAAELSPDGDRVALASADGQLTIWSVNPAPTNFLHCLPQFDTVPSAEEGVSAIRFSGDGRFLAAACRDKKARIFDVETAGLLFELPHEHRVIDVAFSPDNRRLITASLDHCARLWDVGTGQSVGQPLHHDNDVVMARFSPDGRRVATASRDWTARVWDAGTGIPISEPLTHKGPVQVVAFSPDGTRVATGSLDTTARIWDAATGLALSDPFPYSNAVEHVEFAGNGGQLLVVPASGSIEIVEMLQPVGPAPGWLPNLAEAIVRQRLDQQQQSTLPVSADALLQHKRALFATNSTDFIMRWAQWYLSDPDQRPISPNASMTRAEYVNGLLKARTRESLQEAIGLEPTNAHAYLYLAQELSRDSIGNNRILNEAGWYGRYAKQLAPDNEEIADALASLEIRLRLLARPAISR